jgi:glucose/arabinose dehydrogenase
MNSSTNNSNSLDINKDLTSITNQSGLSAPLNVGSNSSTSLLNLLGQSSSQAVSSTGDGLRGEYYDNQNFTNLKLTRVDQTVNFDFGTGSPNASIGKDTFSIRWTGKVEAQYNETYTFYTTTDDGVRLWVNGQQVIDNFRDQVATEVSGNIALEAGKKYDIRLDYYEKTGQAVSKLAWSSTSQVKEIIPKSQLYSPGSPTATLQTTTTPVTGSNNYTFSVNYTDNTSVDITSLDNSDIRVTGNNGFNQLATFISVDNNTNGTPRTATYSINAPGGNWDISDVGNYTIALEANQIRNVNGNFTGASNLGQFTYSVTGTSTGLKGEYYDNKDFTNLKLTRTDGTINFDFGNGSPDASIGADTFSVRWTGFVEAKYSENYTFYTASDDGISLWVNNQQVINRLVDQPVTEFSSTPITLQAGEKYAIRLDYFENKGNAVAKLFWSSASQAKDIISQSQLYTSATGSTDSIAPTASVNASNLTVGNSNNYTFTVTYSDNTAVNVSSLDSSDIQVTNSNGFSQLASLVSVDTNTNGTPRTATYRINAPGTTWTTANNGSYSIALLANQVRDTAGNFASAGTLGNFSINIPASSLPIISLGQVPLQVNEASGIARIEIIRYGDDLSGVSTVNYITTGESATENVDFTKVSGIVTFAPGETSQFVDISILQDSLAEPEETFTFVVDRSEGATLGSARTARIAISDDDQTNLTFSTPTVSENVGLATVVVNRGQATTTASVNYTTVAGTALANTDFQATSGTLNFAIGETSRTINIPIINDAIGEANETFTLKFSNPVGVGLNLQSSTEITIVDDDPGSFVRETFVNGLAAPTTFDWIPGSSTNQMLIAQKNGVVRMSENGSLLTTPFIDISDQVNNTRDRGLLGMAVHPDFSKSGAEKKPYVYLLFTYDPPETKLNLNPNTTLDAPDERGNRPSRLIRVEADPLTNYTTAKAGSEVVLLGKNSTWNNTSRPDGNSTQVILNSDGSINYAANFAPSGIVNQSGQLFTNMQDYYNNLGNVKNIEDYLASDSESHSVGDLEFGTDGSLFVSIGDGTSYNEVDPRAIRVQDLNNLSGKILRIDPITGTGLTDNPFYDSSKPNSNKSKVYDYGLRNPFRFSINEATNTPYIGDVGWKTWEELNAGKAKNFGWPYFEGGDGVSIKQPEYDNLAPAQQFYASGQAVTAPIYAFRHAGADAIVMGDFYTGNTFPSVYKNTLFIANYSKGTVDNITLDSQGKFASIRRFDTFSNPRANAPVQIATGPDGNLYYADIAAGAIGRWRSAAT